MKSNYEMSCKSMGSYDVSTESMRDVNSVIKVAIENRYYSEADYRTSFINLESNDHDVSMKVTHFEWLIALLEEASNRGMTVEDISMKLFDKDLRFQ